MKQSPAPNNAKFTATILESKITKHAKKSGVSNTYLQEKSVMRKIPRDDKDDSISRPEREKSYYSLTPYRKEGRRKYGYNKERKSKMWLRPKSNFWT